MTETVETYMNITSVHVWVSEWLIDTSVNNSW
jgi:hypothetical protein